MAGLEEELGTELIRRSRNGIRPTYFGHRVYEDARQLIAAFRDSERSWRAMLEERSGICGQVRIHCNPGAEAYLSAVVVPELAAAYPGVELLIRPSPEMREGFRSYLGSGCGLGIGLCLSERWEEIRSEAETAGLVCEFFGSEVGQVLLSTRNPMAKGDSLSLEQLKQLDLVWYTFASAPRFQPLFRNVAAKVPNKESMVRMVADSGCAAVFAPSTIRRELSEFRGRVRLLTLNVRDGSLLSVVHFLVHAPESELQRQELCTLELLRRYPYTE